MSENLDQHGELYQTTAILRYSRGPEFYKLIAEIDQSINNYYFSLIPKYIDVNRQMYSAHVSVVRREIPPNLTFWGKYEGVSIKLLYGNIIHFSKVYCWLNVFSDELEEIRAELGLPVASEITRPPEGFTRCFHTTLGNFKVL